jgi:hypothetical protein
MASPLATGNEVRSLGLQFHDLSNSLGMVSQELLDVEPTDSRNLSRGEFEELSGVLVTLRTLARGVTSLIDEPGVPF